MYEFWLLVMGIAFATTILMLVAPRRRLIFAALSLVLWFALSGATAVLSIPYAFYSETDNTIITGTQNVEVGAPGLTSLSFGMGMFSFAWIFIVAIDDYLVRRGRRALIGD